MGSKYEVHSYVRKQETGGYGYEEVWRGESLLKAVLTVIAEKRKGIRCIQLEYRP